MEETPGNSNVEIRVGLSGPIGGVELLDLV